MPEGYKHITYEERCQISALLKSGKTKSEIARLLNRDRRTIAREILRNQGLRGYRYKQADLKSKERRHSASCRPRKMTPQVIERIEFHLRSTQASPEQISGVLSTQEGIKISHERIYQHIWADQKVGGDLYLCLRRKAKKYNKRSSKNAGRGCIPNRTDISQRPDIVEEKSRLGDWEVDTVIGKHGTGVLVTLVDRMSKYTIIILVKNKTEKLVSAAIISALKKIKKSVLTITSDNGKEFAGHQNIARSLDGSFYFATLTSLMGKRTK